jgi:acetoin utilization deacetylase AcuC-like enzyme
MKSDRDSQGGKVTRFYSDERTFWHGGTQITMLTLPVGGWVQPPSGTVGVDTPDTKRRILNLLRASGLLAKLDAPTAAPASLDDLARIHTTAYLERFKTMSDSGGGDLGIAASLGPGGFEIAQVSAGLAKAAIGDVVAGLADTAYALCRPCGHHALPDEAMGSCLLANIPIALAAAEAAHGPRRVAVVDWDVHHGNGTQAIYYDREDVLTISIHQDRCFPFGYGGLDDRGVGAGAGRNLNIPLPPGCGHDAYLYAADRIILPALADFGPDLIVVASGLDACAVDPLSRMLLHSETYRELTLRMKRAAAELCGGRLVMVHEGGYSEAYAPFCGHAIVEALSGISTEVTDPSLDAFTAWQPNDRVQAFHRTLIDEMAETLLEPAYA